MTVEQNDVPSSDPSATDPTTWAHATASVNGTVLHYVSAGDAGTPVLLVHGFPESWWAFHEVIPQLAESHRVVAVDLRGFGDSATAGPSHDSAVAAADLHALVSHLGLGPVHLVAQDISGGTAYRLATTHPGDLLSLTAVEMGLAGFGLEAFADVTSGGSWHVGVLAAPPELAQMLLAGHARELLGSWVFPGLTAVADAVTAEDVAEFARGYERPDGWLGAAGLYRAMLAEGEEFSATARLQPLDLPALAVGGGGGPFTVRTLEQVVRGRVQSVQLDGVGHHVALEAPSALATALKAFYVDVDRRVVAEAG